MTRVIWKNRVIKNKTWIVSVTLLGLIVFVTIQIRNWVHMEDYFARFAKKKGLRSAFNEKGSRSAIRQDSSTTLKDLTNKNSIESRPIIHTFFHSRGAQHEHDVLELWKNEWSDAGFNPVVLTLDDAKKNPYFEEVESIMTPLHGSTGYDSLCFYRWLAMAKVSGGGWMSDHDTFPVNFNQNDMIVLPHHGEFTVYQGHIPAFMAGSAEEWDRVSRLLVAAMSSISNNMNKSDMHALEVLKRQGRSVNGIWFVMPDRKYTLMGFQYDKPRNVNCQWMKVGKVIHMSHASVKGAVDGGVYPLEKSEKDPRGDKRRAEAVKMFLDDWREQCLSSFAASITHGLAGREKAEMILKKKVYASRNENIKI